MNTENRLRNIAVYIVIAFGLSWLLFELFLAFGGRYGSPVSTLVLVVYMFVPAVAAVIVQKAVKRRPVIRPLLVSFKLNGWWAVAWLLPPVIAIATIGVSLLFPGIRYDPEMTAFYERMSAVLDPQQLQQARTQAEALPIHIFWIALIQSLIAGPTINAIAGFGEELGWRGLLQKELSRLNFWKMSALIGIIWGVWHAPIILRGHNYPQHPQLGVLMMIAWTVLLSPIFSYIAIRARSVIAAAVFHGSINASFGLAIIVVSGGNDLTTGVTGLPGFVVLALVNLGLLAYDRFVAAEPISQTMRAVYADGG